MDIPDVVHAGFHPGALGRNVGRISEEEKEVWKVTVFCHPGLDPGSTFSGQIPAQGRNDEGIYLKIVCISTIPKIFPIICVNQ